MANHQQAGALLHIGGNYCKFVVINNVLKIIFPFKVTLALIYIALSKPVLVSNQRKFIESESSIVLSKKDISKIPEVTLLLRNQLPEHKMGLETWLPEQNVT